MRRAFTVFDLLSLDLPDPASLKLKCLAGRNGLEKVIKEPEINRPGLALCGFFENFGENRIQIFGKGETAYLTQLASEKQEVLLTDFFKRKISCCVFTHALQPTEAFLRLSEQHKIPILQTDLASNEFQERLFIILSDAFAVLETLHGVFVEVYGLGLLLKGESGVGKSETALELIERGHRLVADDLVQIRRLGGNRLRGSSTQSISKRHHMEIRGLGIINIPSLFGLRAVRDSKRIDMAIHLESWQNNKNYDRIGTEQQTFEILGVKVPMLTIPVKPGRNIPIIIETAALKERSKLSRDVNASYINF